VGQVWLAHIPKVDVPDTGPVVLLNKEPWGVVTLNLKNAAVSNLHTIEPVKIEHNEKTGEVTAQVQFRQLQYAGDYEVRRGKPTASALKLASAQLRTPTALADADPNDNISLAKSYQDKLSLQSGPNGSLMLDTYYRHNDAYAEAFTNEKFNTQWATRQTSGQTTKDFANHTATAATPGNTGTVSVNGQPDNTGATPYNIHSFTMQLLVVATCNKQNNQDAATAASKFQDSTTTPSQSSQTVDNVMNLVATSPPQTPASALALPQAIEPEWKTKIRRELMPDIEEIERAEDDMQRGIRLREETDKPINGQFSGYFPSYTLTLTGKLGTTANGNPQLKFSSVTGPFGDVPIKLGVFPGKLHGELSESIDKAQFLKSILGKRAVSSIASSKLAELLGHALTLAMNEG